MKNIASAFFVGVLFALGLIVSEMINPKVAQGFLDIFGEWNPSLMFVMIGALSVVAIGYRWVWKRDKPLFEERFSVPKNTSIDKRLAIGAIIFGMGWGLRGLCPGPKIELVVFFIAMIVGMKASDFFPAKT